MAERLTVESRPGKAAAKVLVVDDHPLMRETIANVAREAGYAVFEAGDGERAVEIAAAVQPELVIMDVSMPGMSGIDATRRIVSRDPSVRVVMLSSADSAETVREAVRAGAAGYLTKAVASRATLIDALDRVSAGETVFAPAGLSEVLFSDSAQIMPSDSPELTVRERQIITLAAQSVASSAIAAALGLSTRTVENHLARIYKKLGINSRTQLARMSVDALARDVEHDARQEPDRSESARVITPAGVLVGRAHEFDQLTGMIRDLALGRGRPVLIEGEPGIGKTALIRGALTSAPQGSFQIFWGSGDELGQELPLLPFLDALGVRRPSANARRAAIAGLLRGDVASDRGADVPAMLAEQLIALTIDEPLPGRSSLLSTISSGPITPASSSGDGSRALRARYLCCL